MREHRTEAASVDVCQVCGALWVERFDGDVHSVAASVDELPPTGQPSGTGSDRCPECRTPLHRERYGGDGAELWRCGWCAGTVARRSYEVLIAARSEHAVEPEPPPGRLERVLRLVAEWLGR